MNGEGLPIWGVAAFGVFALVCCVQWLCFFEFL